MFDLFSNQQNSPLVINNYGKFVISKEKKMSLSN